METEKKKRSFPLAFRRTKHRRQKSAPSNAINPVCDITGIEEEIASGGSSELGGSPRPVSPIQMHEVDRHIAAGSDLHVQVISGNGLLAMDGNGLSDPYCMVKLGSVSHRTSTMKETLSPVWNEVFLLHSEEVHKAEGIIKFQLWDADDWSKDDFLGQTKLDIYKLANASQESQTTLELQGSSRFFRDLPSLGGYKSDRGTLTVAVWWTQPSSSLKPERGIGEFMKQSTDFGANLAPSNAPKTKQRYASSLCTAPGLGKVIPAVINTKLGSLYEEPALNYICIELHKVEVYADDTDVSRCPLKICCSAVSAFGKVLGTGKDRKKALIPSPMRSILYQAGPRKEQEKIVEENRFRAKVGGGSNFLDMWASDFDPSTLWNVAESTIPTYDSDQEDDTADSLMGDDDEGEKMITEVDGTLHVKPYWYYKIGFAKQKHTSKSVYNCEDGHMGLEFTDRSIFVAVRPLKNRDISISLYTSPVSHHSSKHELLMKWNLNLFDLLDGKQESWCASGASGVKGRAFIKCSLIDPDVRSMLHKMPPRVQETITGSKHLGIDRKKPEQQAIAKEINAKYGRRNDTKDAFISDGKLQDRGQNVLSSLLPSYSFSGGKQSTSEFIEENTPGEFSIVLESLELEEPVDCFCVLKCGPHWCKTIVHPAAKFCTWEWQIKLPIYDPGTLLVFAAFTEHRRQVIDKGRLRIRLCTLEPNQVYSCRLPIMINGNITGHVNLVMQAKYPEGYWHGPKYAAPELPREIYTFGLHRYPLDRIVKRESTTILLRWLDGSRPRISNAIAHKVLDLSSESFSRRRLRIHFQRIKHCLSFLNPVLGHMESIQAWENPPITIAVLFILCLIVYFPSHALFLGLLSLGLLCSFMFQIPVTVPTMADLPQPLEVPQEETSKPKESTNPYQILKGRYEQVQGILVRLQNAADSIAANLEKAEALLTWRDPTASRIFSFVMFLAAIAVKCFGVQFFLCFGIIWICRPPSLKNPIPPAAINFLARLPSRGDQVL